MSDVFELHLYSETVDKAFPAAPDCVEATTTLAEALDLLKAGKTGCLLVCRDEKLIGIFTERDVLGLMAAAAPLDAPLEQSMVSDPVTVLAEDSLATAIERMSSGGYRHLPIVDGAGRPTGLLMVSGILHFLVEHFPNVVYTLPPHPHHSMSEREGA